MYQKVKGYLNVSRQELRGLLVVFFLMIVLYLFPFIWERVFYQPLEVKIETLKPLISDIESFPNPNQYRDEDDANPLSENIRLFKFNPNHLPIEEWVKLGLSEKQASIIKKYEAKGGKFYKKEDLRKIYSISEKQYLRLAPFIVIPEMARSYEKKFIPHVPRETKSIAVNLNQADSVALLEVKGIGPAFASRIIKYRNRLGGFVNKEQLREVYGIDSLKYSQIEDQLIIDAHNIKYININSVTFDEFKRFPYLSFKQMNAIIAYRKQHGFYNNVADLKKIVLLNQEIIDKIAPYIKFDD
jgi:competence protein ComEA